MSVATWWSQPYRADGAIDAVGIGKQLGTPGLDPLVVMLRETSQNSWDARTSDDTGISLRYRVERLGEARSTAFSLLLFPNSPEMLGALDAALAPDALVVSVSDRGTSGLGGPTRSDTVGGSSRDFVNFVRNVGVARDRDLGGGTYGFGKGALYRLSSVGTVLVDTVCVVDGRKERRLMGAALGHPFDRHEVPYTGRHWWGEMRGGVVEPLVGDAAASVAERLGLLGFAEGETGTDVYVLGALLGEDDAGTARSARSAASVIASAALWYLWPKLVARAERPLLELTVTADGEQIHVPDPGDVSALHPFVESLGVLDTGKGVLHSRQRPSRDEGYFAAMKDIHIPDAEPVVAVAAPFTGPAHHCALMRHVELVVDYLEGPELPNPYQYGAVFRIVGDGDVDASFAAAEPPTHDKWVSKSLSGEAKGTVDRALRFVRDQLRSLAAPADSGSASDGSLATGGLSHALAGVLAGAWGDGAPGRGGVGGGGGGGAPGSVVRSVGAPRLVVRNGVALVAQSVRVDTGTAVAVEATGRVAVDGGTEREAPDGAPIPTVVGWEAAGVWVDGALLDLAAGSTGEWTVYVRPAGDSATTVRVREATG